MYFKQIDEIITGTKTQTRRIVKEGERFLFDDDTYHHWVFTPAGRVKWQVGRDYAVCPGRGKPCVSWNSIAPTPMTDLDPGWSHIEGIWIPLRIRITDIRREPLQDISEADAKAEGVQAELMTWFSTTAIYSYVAPYAQLWDSINKRKGTRWQDNPEVWVLTFEVIK
jgi:hypothetical protein